MPRVSDGTNVNLPSIRVELDEIGERRTALVAELRALDDRRETLEAVLAFGMQEAERTTPERAKAHPDKTHAGHGGRASSAAADPPSTGDLIVAVLRDLPPGESLTARELHARMTDRFGYQLTAETVRKVAQRMVGRHTLVKSGPGTWQLPATQGGDLDS